MKVRIIKNFQYRVLVHTCIYIHIGIESMIYEVYIGYIREVMCKILKKLYSYIYVARVYNKNMLFFKRILIIPRVSIYNYLN